MPGGRNARELSGSEDKGFSVASKESREPTSLNTASVELGRIDDNTTVDTEDDSDEIESSDEEDVPTCSKWKYATDLDFICSYTTTKTVYIQHVVLGCCNIVLTLIIIFGSLFIMVLAEVTHTKQKSPVLSSRLLVEDSSQANVLTEAGLTSATYCRAEDGKVCLPVDDDLLIYPNHQNLYGIVTRSRRLRYTGVPIGRNDLNSDKSPTETDDGTWYTYNVENVVFNLEHAFSIPVFGEKYQKSGYNMKGMLYSTKDGESGKADVKPFDMNGKTLITLNDLLKAAYGPNTEYLNTKCNNINYASEDTIRECGVQLDVVIHYKQPEMNRNPFAVHTFEFEIWVTANSNTEYKVSRIIPENEDTYIVYEYNAIQLRVFAVGRIGKIEIWQIVLTGMVGLVLFSISALIVDFLMLHVLPEKKMYFFFKYEITADVEELFQHQKDMDMSKKQLYILAAKAQANPQIKEQDNRAGKVIKRMERQFDEELDRSMKEIEEQLKSLQAKNSETVAIEDQTLQAVQQAFEWAEEAESEYVGPPKIEDKGRRFQQIQLKSVVSTVVFLPKKPKTSWKQHPTKFAKYVRDDLQMWEPERVEGRKIITSRGFMVAAQVELARHMTLEDIDTYNNSRHSHSDMNKYLLVSYKDILWTEMEMIFDDVDPERTGFVTEDKFRELLTRCSKMGKTKIDFYYRKLRLRNENGVGVDIKEIADRMFTFADQLETCGASVILVAVLKELMKDDQTKREKEAADLRDIERSVASDDNVFAVDRSRMMYH